MKTQFSKPSNGTTFKDLKVGEVFTVVAAGRNAIPLVRVVLPRSSWNAVNSEGHPASIVDNELVTRYPNAILVMGEPA